MYSYYVLFIIILVLDWAGHKAANCPESKELKLHKKKNRDVKVDKISIVVCGKIEERPTRKKN